MSTDANSLNIRILDKDYRITCPPGEQESLQASARLLNEKINDIRAKGAIIGGERLAIMAALNLAHELLTCQEYQSGYEDMQTRIGRMQQKINIVLKDIELS